MVAIAVLLGTGDLARAGALNKVVGGLKHASGQSGSGSNSSDSHTRDHRASSGSDNSDSSDSDSSNSDSGAYVGYGPRHSATTPSFFVGAYPYPTNSAGADVRIYLGIHAVEASDGAGAVSARASYGDFGIELADVSYYERSNDPRQEYITLDVWTMGFAYRVVASGPREQTAIWLKGGLAGAKSDGLDILGGMVGAELAHNLTNTLGVDSSARLFAYQDGIRAVELRTGIAASIVRLSYRVLKFNVGPVLRGPEVGVSLSF